MESYKCRDCGAVFATPDTAEWWENHGHGMREHWVEDRCPQCGSADIDTYYGSEDAETTEI